MNPLVLRIQEKFNNFKRIDVGTSNEEVFTYHRCKLCPYKTKSIHIMMTHLKRHRVTKHSKKFNCFTNKLERYRCNWCSYKTALLINYNKHVEMAHRKSIEVKVEEGAEDSVVLGNINFFDLLKTYSCECSFKTFSKLLYINHYLKCAKFVPERTLNEEKEYEIEIIRLYDDDTPGNFDLGQADPTTNNTLKKAKRNQVYECSQCPFITKYSPNLQRHKEIHKPDDERPWFYCDFCDFKTHTKKGKNSHISRIHRMTTQMAAVIHEEIVEEEGIRTVRGSNESRDESGNYTEIYLTDDSSDVDIIDELPKKSSKRKLYRNKNYKRHSEIIYKCTKCPFETIVFWNYRRHLLFQHGSDQEIGWLNCSKCSYKTINKKRFDKHVENTHVGPNTRAMFKCDMCDYSNVDEKLFKGHIDTYNHLVNKSVDTNASVATYCCDSGDFKTNHYDSLKEHILIKHISFETVTSYKCELCTYETVVEREMKTHISEKHVDPQCNDWLGCEICPAKFKTDSELKTHVMEKHIL